MPSFRRALFSLNNTNHAVQVPERAPLAIETSSNTSVTSGVTEPYTQDPEELQTETTPSPRGVMDLFDTTYADAIRETFHGITLTQCEYEDMLNSHELDIADLKTDHEKIVQDLEGKHQKILKRKMDYELDVYTSVLIHLQRTKVELEKVRKRCRLDECDTVRVTIELDNIHESICERMDALYNIPKEKK